jgi:hypothetical protein
MDAARHKSLINKQDALFLLELARLLLILICICDDVICR